MKILNKPIKVLTIFYTNGNIEPVKFRLEDKVVRIDRVVKVYEEHIVGNVRVVFVCIQNEKYTYELKYELESSIWYLFKK